MKISPQALDKIGIKLFRDPSLHNTRQRYARIISIPNNTPTETTRGIKLSLTQEKKHTLTLVI